MTDKDEIIELLRRIEANQLRALEAQQEQLTLARAQVERAEQRVAESISLQKVAVQRQAKAAIVFLPVVVALLALLVYLLVRWRHVL
jgi:cytochrome c-type biogenesis protein CcmH/NrfG